jgi:hypothetical protein
MNWAAEHWLYILIYGIGILLIIGFVAYANKQKQARRDEPKDVRSELRPNDTNYNMSMFDREKLEKMSDAELAQILKKSQEGEITSLSHRDFHFIKTRLKDSQDNS